MFLDKVNEYYGIEKEDKSIKKTRTEYTLWIPILKNIFQLQTVQFSYLWI